MAKRLSQFEGSPNARTIAVMELTDLRNWKPVATFLRNQTLQTYNKAILDAFARTPKGLRLETDRDEIVRVRKKQYSDTYRFVVSFNSWQQVEVDQVWKNNLKIAGLQRFHPEEDWSGGRAWFSILEQPLWYYKTNDLRFFNYDRWVAEVSGQVAEGARFAGLLFPMMIKYAGLALSFSPNPAIMIAGVLVEKFGEIGERDVLREKQPGARELVTDAGKEIILNLVLGRIFRGGGGGSGERALAEEGEAAASAYESIAETAAREGREAVKSEIARTEAPQVASALRAGEARTLHGGEYTLEVDIQHEGGSHIYRRTQDGNWCRWSELRVCDLDLGPEVEAARARPAERTVLNPSVLPQYTSKDSFMTAMRRQLLARRAAGKPSLLDFLLDAEGGWQKGSFVTKTGRTIRGRYALSNPDAQLVQAGHLQSDVYAKAVGKREYLMLEDADLNWLTGQTGEARGAYLSKPAVVIDGIAVDVPTARLYESYELLPAGTVDAAPVILPPEF